MIKGYMESKLSDSEIFQGLAEINKDVISKAINLIKNSKHLTVEDIETSIIQLKQISESLTVKALRAFENGDIVLIYNNVPKLSLTQTLPFLTFKTKDKYITYIFMDRFISITRDGVLNLSATILRDLLCAGLIANGLKYNYGAFASNQYLAKTLMSIYTQFCFRIINKDYSIASDKIIYDSVQYYINRFFLENIFNLSDTPENIHILSSKHFKYIDEIQSNGLKENYENLHPSKFSELLSLLSEVSPRMKNINKSTFLSSWINYYYTPSMMAVDNIEYIILMILCLLNGNNIINVNASDIVKETKGIKDLRGELLKIS